MKRLLIAICMLIGLQQITRAQELTITYQQFYNDLEPYGTWIYYPDYGYVWEPYFERPDNFMPYSSGGHWVYTDYGWTWVSDYPWGWATFHYGRWLYDDYLGWLWVPGYEWAPAWVTWGSYGGNYGWAPLAPGISVSVGWRPPRSYWWTFVPCSRLGSSNWNNYIVRDNSIYVNRVTIINNIYRDNGRSGGGRPWMRGPRREEVEHFVNRPIRPVAINMVNRPGATRIENNRLAIFRPTVRETPRDGGIKPARVQTLQNIRPESRLPVHDRRTNDPGRNNPGNRQMDRRNDQPGNRPGDQPGNRPNNPPQPGNLPPNPGNRPGNPPQHDRPDRPYNPNRPDRPYNPNNPNRPDARPVNPGSRPENKPTMPPQRPETKPPVNPPNRREQHQNNPAPERPVNRPPDQPPVMPGNRPANPNPAMPPQNHPMPQQNHPGGPPPNRPVTPPPHRREPPPGNPPQQPPPQQQQQPPQQQLPGNPHHRHD